MAGPEGWAVEHVNPVRVISEAEASAFFLRWGCEPLVAAAGGPDSGGVPGGPSVGAMAAAASEDQLRRRPAAAREDDALGEEGAGPFLEEDGSDGDSIWR